MSVAASNRTEGQRDGDGDDNDEKYPRPHHQRHVGDRSERAALGGRLDEADWPGNQIASAATSTAAAGGRILLRFRLSRASAKPEAVGHVGDGYHRSMLFSYRVAEDGMRAGMRQDLLDNAVADLLEYSRLSRLPRRF